MIKNPPEGTIPWKQKPDREVQRIQERRREQLQIKERAFGQSTETVAENDILQVSILPYISILKSLQNNARIRF